MDSREILKELFERSWPDVQERMEKRVPLEWLEMQEKDLKMAADRMPQKVVNSLSISCGLFLRKLMAEMVIEEFVQEVKKGVQTEILRQHKGTPQ